MRAKIFSLAAECAIAKCPLTPGGAVAFAVAQCHVSVEVAQSALEDLVALGLVELLPHAVTLSALSERLARKRCPMPADTLITSSDGVLIVVGESAA